MVDSHNSFAVTQYIVKAKSRGVGVAMARTGHQPPSPVTPQSDLPGIQIRFFRDGHGTAGSHFRALGGMVVNRSIASFRYTHRCG